MIWKFNTIGKEEEEAVLRVIRSGNLSGYLAGNDRAGPEVTALEKEWSEFFAPAHELRSIACNSATSGLLAACMAIGVGPYDEVIVPYFTMSATAAAPGVLGARVVLADIDPETFCIDPVDVSNLINENTKAVIATNMFGHPGKLHQLRSICHSNNVVLIEDNAQAIMAKEDDVYTGLIGDIGVFSLNVHKHIQCGEGGVIVTRILGYDWALRKAINHGENRSVLTGLNLRMTEIMAAIAREQLKKLPEIMRSRRHIGHELRDILAIPYNQGTTFKPFWSTPQIRTDCEHSFYAVPGIVAPDYDFGEMVKHLRAMSPIPITMGYAGNLLTTNVKGVSEAPERVHHLAKQPAYSIIHRMFLIEPCAYDIQQQHLDKLRKNLSEGRGNP